MDNTFSISRKNWTKVIDYAAIAYNEHKSEIGGMMVVIEDDDGDWELINPVILKQTITASNTHLDKDELAIYYTKMGKKYKNKNFRFCWWHSHHTMDAFWSGTDLSTIDEFDEGDFSFALVVNLKEEYKFRVSVWKPFETHKDVELDIPKVERKVSNKMVNEVEELCSKPELMKYNHHNSNQISLLNGKWKGRDYFNHTSDEPSYDYTEAYKLLDRLIDGTCDGTIKYSEYRKEISVFNKGASEQQTGILIGVLSDKDWKKAVLITTPANHIVDTDMESYNDSFNMHERWGI